MNKPKYKIKKYVNVHSTNGVDDFGKELYQHDLDSIRRGFKPLWDIYSIFIDKERFVYCFSNGYRFYEENLSDWGYTWQPEATGFAEEIYKTVSDEIKNYQRKISELEGELENVKLKQESKELQALRKLNEDLVKKLDFYADGHARVSGDQNGDDCSGRYLQWGIKAKDGVSQYNSYCKEFGAIPIVGLSSTY